jgi:hypothetical protein
MAVILHVMFQDPLLFDWIFSSFHRCIGYDSCVPLLNNFGLADEKYAARFSVVTMCKYSSQYRVYINENS